MFNPFSEKLPTRHMDALDLEAEAQSKAIRAARAFGCGQSVNGKGKKINGGSGRSTAIPCGGSGGDSYARVRLYKV